MKVCFIIPTNKPDVLDRYACSDLSLQNLESMKERCEVHFSLVLQPPFTTDKMIEIVDRIGSHGFYTAASIVPQENPARMAHLRDIGAQQFASADYYCFWDDNLEACPGTNVYWMDTGRRYLQVLDYFEKFLRCGIVSCVGTRGGNHSGWTIKPSNRLWGTDRGLWFRNAFRGELFHADDVKVLGGLEEPAAGFKLIENGFYFAKQFNNPTRHHGRMKQEYDGSAEETRDRDFRIHDRDRNRASERLIMDRYGDPGETFRDRHGEGMGFYPPRGLMDLYYTNGGLTGIYPAVTRNDLNMVFTNV